MDNQNSKLLHVGVRALVDESIIEKNYFHSVNYSISIERKSPGLFSQENFNLSNLLVLLIDPIISSLIMLLNSISKSFFVASDLISFFRFC